MANGSRCLAEEVAVCFLHRASIKEPVTGTARRGLRPACHVVQRGFKRKGGAPMGELQKEGPLGGGSTCALG